MIIYEPVGEDDYECLNCDISDDYEVFRNFDGSSRIKTWRPIKVRSHPADQSQKGLPCDFPWLGSDVLVMRKRAVLALRDILDAHGELLPLVLPDGVELQAFNARTVDALDEPQSNIMRVPNTNRIMYIKRVAFIEANIRGLDIFRLPHRASPTYVSQRFVDRVESAELVGLEFDRVWSSE